MNEADNNPQEPEPQTYEPTTASVVLGIFGLVILMLIPSYGMPPPVGFSVFPIVGLVLGIVALVKIKRSKGRFIGSASAVFGIIINGFLIFGLVCGFWAHHRRRVFLNRVPCTMSLHGLGNAMMLYASDNDGKYPTADKWCDLLSLPIRSADRRRDLLSQPVRYVDELERFVCKPAGEGRCHYAINPNAEPNSPPDMVLLFESKGGWNQLGGAELLTTDNHKGKGCNILFNDGHIKFMKLKQLKKLKWKVGEDER